MQASIMPEGRRSTLAVFSCSCSAVRRAVLLSMRAFRSATLSRYSASFVACAATSVSQQCPHQDGGARCQLRALQTHGTAPTVIVKPGTGKARRD